MTDSRVKGKHAEQEVARLLRVIAPDVRTKRAGGESASQDRGRDLLGTPGLCVQVKCHARPQPIAALGEALQASAADEIPVAICRQSSRSKHSRWTATITLEDLIGLVSLARHTATNMRHAAVFDSGSTNGSGLVSGIKSGCDRVS